MQVLLHAALLTLDDRADSEKALKNVMRTVEQSHGILDRMHGYLSIETETFGRLKTRLAQHALYATPEAMAVVYQSFGYDTLQKYTNVQLVAPKGVVRRQSGRKSVQKEFDIPTKGSTSRSGSEIPVGQSGRVKKAKGPRAKGPRKSREEQEATELSHIQKKMVHLQAKAAAFTEVAEARKAVKLRELEAEKALAGAGPEDLHVVTAKVTRDPPVDKAFDSEFEVGLLGGRDIYVFDFIKSGP
jgi:hypothetical protein